MLNDELFNEDWTGIFHGGDKLTEVRILPVQKILLPYEERIEQIKNPVLQKVLLDEYGKGKYVALIYSPKGDKTLPPIGSIGTGAAFSLRKINKKNFMVKFMALPRYETIKYLERGTLYPMTEIEYFDDDLDTDKAATLEAIKLTVKLMKETDIVRGYRDKPDTGRTFLDLEGGAYCASFGMFRFWQNAELRQMILGLRSSRARLEYLNALIYSYNQKEAVAERNARFN